MISYTRLVSSPTVLGIVPNNGFWLRSKPVSPDMDPMDVGMVPATLLPTTVTLLWTHPTAAQHGDFVPCRLLDTLVNSHATCVTYTTGPVPLKHWTPSHEQGFVFASQPQVFALDHCVRPGDVDTNKSTRAARLTMSQFTYGKDWFVMQLPANVADVTGSTDSTALGNEPLSWLYMRDGH